MKILFFTIALICTLTVSAQQPDKYTQAMYANMAKVDSAKTVREKLELSNTFERIAKAEKDKWQPYYYAAMLQILRTYEMKGNETQNIDEVLNKADNLLISAEVISPNNSEILCLQSMATSARIPVDYMTRGAQYGQQASEILKKAIKADPSNPRAYLLMGQTTFYTPEFIGGGKDKAKPLIEKSLELFETFKPSSTLDPVWGKPMAQLLLKQYN
ncbi:MAG: hypothetical protein LBL90_08325 [Prevotellaceae bacterium]|jgi:hypothetical protein|nr:hypothetical protein [Prevotellaceae bacterium]